MGPFCALSLSNFTSSAPKELNLKISNVFFFLIKFDPVAVFKEYFQEYIAIADLLLDLERAHTSEKHDSLVYKILQANNKRDAEHEHGTDACKKSSNLNVT